MIIDVVYELLMGEVPSAHNDNILTNIVFAVILDYHIAIDILDIINAA
jgi:hypothetical protein